MAVEVFEFEGTKRFEGVKIRLGLAINVALSGPSSPLNLSQLQKPTRISHPTYYFTSYVNQILMISKDRRPLIIHM